MSVLEVAPTERQLCYFTHASSVGWLLEFYNLAPSSITSGQTLTLCTHGDFIVQPHFETRPPEPWHDIPLSHINYPDIKPTSPCLSLIVPSARLGSCKYQFDKSFVWLDQGSNQCGFESHYWPKWETGAQHIRPSHLVCRFLLASFLCWGWLSGSHLRFTSTHHFRCSHCVHITYVVRGLSLYV